MLSLQLQAIPPNACTTLRFLARPTAWVGLVSCKQVLDDVRAISSAPPQAEMPTGNPAGSRKEEESAEPGQGIPCRRARIR